MIDPDETDSTAVAREEGRRAAARGAATGDNPYRKLVAAWIEGFNEVEDRRLKGEDRGGHPGSVPHMCRAASRAMPSVCNCCDGCARGCAPGAGERAGALVGRVLHKLGMHPRR